MKSKWTQPLIAAAIFCLIGGLLPSGAQASGVVFVTGGNFGVANPTPGFKADVNGNLRVVNLSGGTAAQIFQIVGGANARRWQFQLPTGSGNFEIRDQTGGATPFTIEKGAPANLFRLTAAGTVQVKGGVVHADYVFEPDYPLLSIEDHALQMFENKSLPAVGPGEYDEDGRAVMDIFAKSNGILEELEVAHVYIAQLDEALKKNQEFTSQLVERIEQLEAQLAASR